MEEKKEIIELIQEKLKMSYEQAEAKYNIEYMSGNIDDFIMYIQSL